MIDLQTLTKWQASLQDSGGDLRVYFWFHDALHGLSLEAAQELRDVLDYLLSDADFVQRQRQSHSIAAEGSQEP